MSSPRAANALPAKPSLQPLYGYLCMYLGIVGYQTRCSVEAAHPGSRRHYLQTLGVLTQKVEDHNPFRENQ